jgi:hypothetical protein
VVALSNCTDHHNHEKNDKQSFPAFHSSISCCSQPELHAESCDEMSSSGKKFPVNLFVVLCVGIFTAVDFGSGDFDWSGL